MTYVRIHSHKHGLSSNFRQKKRQLLYRKFAKVFIKKSPTSVFTLIPRKVSFFYSNCHDFVTKINIKCHDFITKINENCIDFITKYRKLSYSSGKNPQ